MVILLRSLLFALSFYSMTVVCCLFYLPLLLLPRAWFKPFAHFWHMMSGWLIRHVAGIRHEMRGQENIPNGPVIYAVKHQSAWETILLESLFNDPVFVMKQELSRIPIFGWHLSRLDNVSIDRTAGPSALSSMVRQTKSYLEQGRSIIIFPQGTRTPPGDSNRPYLPGVAGLYARAHVPVVPVALNSGLFWRRNGFIKHPGKVLVECLPPIQPGLHRREFLRELQSRIESATARLELEGQT